jgi:hypothetical protein
MQIAYAILIAMAVKKQTSRRTRTYARNRPVISRRGNENLSEPDGVYLFKLVVAVLLGMLWVRLHQPLQIAGVPVGAFPVGTAVGLLLIAAIERYQFNRKILYAVLMIVTIIGFFLNAGIVL